MELLIVVMKIHNIFRDNTTNYFVANTHPVFPIEGVIQTNNYTANNPGALPGSQPYHVTKKK
jgi:hypothetical protein